MLLAWRYLFPSHYSLKALELFIASQNPTRRPKENPRSWSGYQLRYGIAVDQQHSENQYLLFLASKITWWISRIAYISRPHTFLSSKSWNLAAATKMSSFTQTRPSFAMLACEFATLSTNDETETKIACSQCDLKHYLVFLSVRNIQSYELFNILKTEVARKCRGGSNSTRAYPPSTYKFQGPLRIAA